MHRTKIAVCTGAACFVSGGLAYGAVEILWRGYTHFSMLITGGLCFLILCRLARMERSWLTIAVLGGLAVTAVELVVGCTVNLWLGWAVWDYSKETFNLWGQVCPAFTAVWCGFAAMITGIYRLYRQIAERRKKSEEPLPLLTGIEENRSA